MTEKELGLRLEHKCFFLIVDTLEILKQKSDPTCRMWGLHHIKAFEEHRSFKSACYKDEEGLGVAMAWVKLQS